jgi:hypothetical protein
MKHILFNGTESPDEIKRILIDNCEGVEEKTYTKRLTEDELQEKNQQFIDANINIDKADETLSQAKHEHKSIVKPLKDERKHLLRTVKTKHEEITGPLYRLANHADGMIDYVDLSGNIIESRRMKPEEKQGRMFVASNNRTGTEG